MKSITSTVTLALLGLKKLSYVDPTTLMIWIIWNDTQTSIAKHLCCNHSYSTDSHSSVHTVYAMKLATT